MSTGGKGGARPELPIGGTEQAARPPTNEAELLSADAEGVRTMRHGRIAAFLFIAGGIAGTPAIALQGVPTTTYLLTLLALGSGLACLLIPWTRVSPRWLHAVCTIASIEVLATTMLVTPVFSWYFILVTVYAAYVFSCRWEVALQVALAGSLMFGSAAVEAGADGVVNMLIAVTALLTTTVLVWTLRQQLEASRAGYRTLSRRDALTGVGNYRRLHDAVDVEILRHDASQRRFSLVLVDLDEFKRINDRQGHLEGDRLLREVASVLANSSRERDVLARHGGDEFCIVAPETSEQEAAGLALRLETAVSDLRVDGGALRACTGVAVYPDHGTDSDALLRHADLALRHEKRLRRGVPSPAGSIVADEGESALAG